MLRFVAHEEFHLFDAEGFLVVEDVSLISQRAQTHPFVLSHTFDDGSFGFAFMRDVELLQKAAKEKVIRGWVLLIEKLKAGELGEAVRGPVLRRGGLTFSRNRAGGLLRVEAVCFHLRAGDVAKCFHTRSVSGERRSAGGQEGR